MEKSTKWGQIVAVLALITGAFALIRDIYDYKIHNGQNNIELPSITHKTESTETRFDSNNDTTNNLKIEINRPQNGSIIGTLYSKPFLNQITLSKGYKLRFTENGLFKVIKSGERGLIFKENWQDSSLTTNILNIGKIEQTTFPKSIIIEFKDDRPIEIIPYDLIVFNDKKFSIFVEDGLKKYNKNIEFKKNIFQEGMLTAHIILMLLLAFIFYLFCVKLPKYLRGL